MNFLAAGNSLHSATTIMKNGYLSKWAQNVSPSPTLAVDAKAKALKAAGEDVCGFGAGEPDFDTPSFLKDACAKALAEGKTKYAPAAGLPDLRASLAEQYAGYGVLAEASPSQVVVSPGGKYSCYLAILATCGPGDEVIVPSKSYVSSASCVVNVNAKPIFSDVDLNSQNISVEKIKKLINPKTKAIICVHLGGYPCEMEKIVPWAKKKN